LTADSNYLENAGNFGRKAHTKTPTHKYGKKARMTFKEYKKVVQKRSPK
jgi:hypothetical protein